jgi:Tol biopolymer transport system component
VTALVDEPHLADIRQLTPDGENAEAYWSSDGSELILKSRRGDADCDRIFRMSVPKGPNHPDAGPAGESFPSLVPVSSGNGATTCSYFMPGDREVIFASTHLGGDVCPPKPDRSQGYVWALYDSYDIWKARPDGTGLVRLTDTKGYDAEGTVCQKDGSIVFTSVRDGDIDLYRMDADGKNVKRLTSSPGYDGGAFFNADCSKIVWRASRPHPGKELDDFKALLASGLVRPSKPASVSDFSGTRSIITVSMPASPVASANRLPFRPAPTTARSNRSPCMPYRWLRFLSPARGRGA